MTLLTAGIVLCVASLIIYCLRPLPPSNADWRPEIKRYRNRIDIVLLLLGMVVMMLGVLSNMM